MNTWNIKSLFLISLVFVCFSINSCDLLEVDDLGSIQEGDLQNPNLEQLIVNGALSEFQFSYSYLTMTVGTFTDEIIVDHTNLDWREFVLRNQTPSNALNENTFVFLQKARASAEDGLERLANFRGNGVGQTIDFVKLHNWAGYSYIFLGENFRQAPVDLSEAFTSEELLGMALTHFEDAINISQNIQQNSETEKQRNLALLGSARASLQLGMDEQARNFAVEVADDFEFWVYRSTNSSREENFWERPMRLSDPFAGVGPNFMFLDDPRIRHTEESHLGLNAEEIFLPFQPFNYGGWDRDDPRFVERATNIRFASSLEANYIIAEVDGPSTNTLNFVNERREFAGQVEVDLSGEELMAELREQRARDFYLTGNRLADIRRYKAKYNIDLYPSGDYPLSDRVYGGQETFVIPLSEISGNPNL